MAIQTPWGAPYGGPQPPSPNIPSKDLRPRRIWYLVAAVVGLVLAGVGTVLIVMAVKNTVDSINTARTFRSGEARTFGFVEGETKAIYVSQAGKGHVDCRIRGAGWSGSMTQPHDSFRITLGSRSWERVFVVKPDSSGDYTLTCTSELPAEFALGDKPDVGNTIGSIAAGIACFIAAFVSALTIIVVTAVRRGNHRRRLTARMAPPPQWGPPPYGPTSGPPAGPMA